MPNRRQLSVRGAAWRRVWTNYRHVINRICEWVLHLLNSAGNYDKSTIPLKNRLIAGFSIPEAVIALAIASIGMASVFTLNQSGLRLTRSARQSNAATLTLQEMVERMRLGNWRKITDPSYIQASLFAAPPPIGGSAWRFE